MPSLMGWKVGGEGGFNGPFPAGGLGGDGGGGGAPVQVILLRNRPLTLAPANEINWQEQSMGLFCLGTG